ncbi:MAG: hypothetical protein ACRDLF_06205 [Solirubrobacteraceae bacterium]
MKRMCISMLAGVALVVSGCGGSSDPPTPSAKWEAAHPIDVILADCSSYQPYLARFIPGMVEIAENSAVHRRDLYAACFDGAPLRTLQWAIKENFGEPYPGETAKESEGENLASAAGLREAFEKMIKTPERVRGSGQLEALELVAETPGVGRVWMFTDAIPNEVEGIVLEHASENAIDKTAETWIPRMGKGLRNVQVAFVGVGFGTYSTIEVRKAKVLFKKIVEGAGGHFVWTQTPLN